MTPRYLLYARKSTESEDRQVLSLDSQVKELTDLARSRGADIELLPPESRSAKAPGRPIFGRLMEQITKKGADGLLCWKLDRLARNPVDGAALIWAMDQGRLREIVTPGRTFTNRGDDKFWMQLEFGMAKKYVDDLSDNVKRGIRAKLEMGWSPGLPPLGYLNDLATKTIVADPDRFPLLRKMWDQILAGLPPYRVLWLANNRWGLRTRTLKHHHGGPLRANVFYRMLSNPYYYGLIVREDKRYVGAHPPLITKDEFDAVQRLLFRPNRMETRTHLFAYAGLMSCGECGASVTAEDKINPYGSHYIYYHCTKRKVGVSCHQRFVPLATLETEILAALEAVEISEAYRVWALRQLDVVRRDDGRVVEKAVTSAEEARALTKRKLDRLTEMRVSEEISAQEFALKREELIQAELRLIETIGSARTESEWIHQVEKLLSFAEMAKTRFASATPEEKREIMVAVGSHFELRDRKLNVSYHEPFRLLRDLRQPSASESPRFSLPEIGSDSGESSRFLVTDSTHRGEWDLFRTSFYEHPTLIRWPTWCLSRVDGLTVASEPGIGKGSGDLSLTTRLRHLKKPGSAGPIYSNSRSRGRFRRL